jgi:preprotein translocase subunit SecD
MIHFPRWKILATLGACLVAIVLILPNFLPLDDKGRLFGFLPGRQISLGLDLQGGSHLLLQVDLDAVVRDRMAGLVDPIRSEFRKANIAYTDLAQEGDRITLKLSNPAEGDAARRAVLTADEELDWQLAQDGRVTLVTRPQSLQTRRQAAVQQSIEIIRRRVDETGTREPNIQQQGSDRILVQLPGVRDPQRIKDLIGKTAKLTFRMVDGQVGLEESRRQRPPAGTDFIRSQERESGLQFAYVVRKRVLVSGDNLTDAQPSFQDGQPVVSFRFDTTGARRFADATTENVGRPFAIVLDDEVISAPVIREPITGGRGIISGNFTAQSASDLALLLRAGALPAPLKVVEERSVGPDLGADSIKAGTYASIAGYILIAVLMVVGYGLFGLYANVALFMNLVITMAFMSLLQATLTLPGLAGMVLGLAMAVDANVLIYERMREEQDAGRTPISAVDAGFSRAFGTILDSNLTTLAAALFLYIFGSGPVRGFAITLGLGLMASMFTAVTLTRLMVITWLRARKRTALPL